MVLPPGAAAADDNTLDGALAAVQTKNEHFADALALLTDDVGEKHGRVEAKLADVGAKLEASLKELSAAVETLAKTKAVKDRAQDELVDSNYQVAPPPPPPPPPPPRCFRCIARSAGAWELFTPRCCWRLAAARACTAR